VNSRTIIIITTHFISNDSEVIWILFVATSWTCIRFDLDHYLSFIFNFASNIMCLEQLLNGVLICFWLELFGVCNRYFLWETDKVNVRWEIASSIWNQEVDKSRVLCHFKFSIFYRSIFDLYAVWKPHSMISRIYFVINHICEFSVAISVLTYLDV